MSGIKKQSNLTQKQAKRSAEAFHNSPGMQRLREYFTKAPPPWPKVRDMSQGPS